MDPGIQEPGDLHDPSGADAQHVDRAEPEPIAVRVAW
jgi:hypothetical protein